MLGQTKIAIGLQRTAKGSSCWCISAFIKCWFAMFWFGSTFSLTKKGLKGNQDPTSGKKKKHKEKRKQRIINGQTVSYSSSSSYSSEKARGIAGSATEPLQSKSRKHPGSLLASLAVVGRAGGSGCSLGPDFRDQNGPT